MIRPSIFAAIAMVLAGCDGSEPESNDGEKSVVATKKDTELADWLTPIDPIDTGRWLASREAGRILAQDDPASAQMRRSLGRAHSFFIEDTRMIANRTVQLGTMLSEIGHRESYESLIEGLTRVAQAGNGKSLYGALCEHYYNARQQGAERDAALDRLAAGHGADKTGKGEP